VKNNKGLFLVKFLKEPSSPEKWISRYLDPINYDFIHNPSSFLMEENFFNSYFNGEKVDSSKLEIDILSGTEWQKKVWNETKKIPYGETRTYKFISERLNSKGFRSVGRALGKNPLLVVIPCHRVIKTNGELGGFSAGLDLKKYFLKLEGIRI
jgi:O-6-methylguanine DNA methyltransferase